MRHFIRDAFWYSAASSVALAVDVGSLWVLVERLHWHYLTAATVGFVAGTIVIYAFSVGWIFQHRRLDDRRLEFGIFGLIGVLGVLVNLVVLRVAVEAFDVHYLAGKLVSIFFTFTLNFGLRRGVLFSAAPPKLHDKTSRRITE